jgi:hypothetical protein
MWNSWVDVDIVQTIKNLSNKHRPWLYLRPLRGINDRDRMENEELLLSLAFLDYMDSNEPTRKSLDIYQKTERINARLSNKAYISTVLQHVTEGQESKNIEFKESIKKVKSFVQKLKYVILDCDKTKDELYDYLKNELDLLFKANKETRYFKRTKQDFYIIWYLLSKINLEMVKYHRLEMKERLFNIFNYMKNIPEEAWLNNQGYNNFINLCDSFVNQYSIEHRRLTLSENEKHELIKSQQNLSPLSSSPIFLGDDIEVDHTIALAIGGSDSLENVTVVHKDENRTKGSKY